MLPKHWKNSSKLASVCVKRSDMTEIPSQSGLLNMYLHSTPGAVGRVSSFKEVYPAAESPTRPPATSTKLMGYEPLKAGQEGVQEDDVDYEVVRGESGEKKDTF